MPNTPPDRRPNVLFIIVDDHQFDALGCVDHPVVRTPALDGLAGRGTLFTRATNFGSLMPAICSPARACLLTGCHPFQANSDPKPGGGSTDFVEIPENLQTLPEIFGAAGYETFFTGKWHNDRASFLRSFAHGKRIFHGGMCEHTEVPLRDHDAFARDDEARVGSGYSTELFCGAAADFLRRRDEARPFFAWLALTSPHDPRTPPEAFRRLYDPPALPLPPAFAPEPAFDNGEIHVRDELLAPKPLRPAVIREHLADYYGMISHHDHEIGLVLEALRESGCEEDTIVVYVGDHGLALGRHGLLGKQNLYEHSVRVPMIMAGPGIRPGVRADGLVYSLDLFATLLALTGLRSPDGLESRSFVPVLDHPELSARDEVFSLYKDCQRMMKNDRWKLIEYLVRGERRCELFDLEEDPHEENDRSADPECAAMANELRARLVAWQRRIGDDSMAVESDTQPLTGRK